MAQVPSSTNITYADEASALSIPELRPKDFQDNILATVGDILTTLLEEELAAESAAKSNVVESAAVADQIRPADADGRSTNVAPTNSEA